MDKGLTLGLSYVVYTASSVANIIQGRRVLKNPRIELSQDFGAALAYHGLERVKVLKGEKETRSTVAALAPVLVSLLWTIPREFAFISLALLSDDNMQKLIVLKSGQTLMNFLQAGGAEIALRTIGRERKPKQSLPPSCTIFDVKKES